MAKPPPPGFEKDDEKVIRINWFGPDDIRYVPPGQERNVYRLETPPQKPRKEGSVRGFDRWCQEKSGKAVLAIGLVGLLASQAINLGAAHYTLQREFETHEVDCMTAEQHGKLEATAPHPYHALARNYISLFQCE